MKISIVVPAYNEEAYIGKTLESLKNLETLPGWDVELIVVDGDSTDRTREIAKEFGARVVKTAHKGIGFARQEGVREAKGEIIAFTDADTIVPADWLKIHVEALLAPGVVMSAGLFHAIDGKFPYFQYINYVQPYLYRLLYFLFYLPISSGQNLAFWKDKAMEVGGFDENIRIMEDIDLAVRMRRVGKVLLNAKSIVHSSGRRSDEGWKFFTRAGLASFQYFVLGRKNLGGFPNYR